MICDFFFLPIFFISTFFCSRNKIHIKEVSIFFEKVDKTYIYFQDGSAVFYVLNKSPTEFTLLDKALIKCYFNTIKQVFMLKVDSNRHDKVFHETQKDPNFFKNIASLNIDEFYKQPSNRKFMILNEKSLWLFSDSYIQIAHDKLNFAKTNIQKSYPVEKRLIERTLKNQEYKNESTLDINNEYNQIKDFWIGSSFDHIPLNLHLTERKMPGLTNSDKEHGGRDSISSVNSSTGDIYGLCENSKKPHRFSIIQKEIEANKSYYAVEKPTMGDTDSYNEDLYSFVMNSNPFASNFLDNQNFIPTEKNLDKKPTKRSTRKVLFRDLNTDFENERDVHDRDRDIDFYEIFSNISSPALTKSIDLFGSEKASLFSAKSEPHKKRTRFLKKSFSCFSSKEKTHKKKHVLKTRFLRDRILRRFRPFRYLKKILYNKKKNRNRRFKREFRKKNGYSNSTIQKYEFSERSTTITKYGPQTSPDFLIDKYLTSHSLFELQMVGALHSYLYVHDQKSTI